MVPVVLSMVSRQSLVTVNQFLFFRKSTFFNVLTKSAATAENFPFCTIGIIASSEMMSKDY